VTSYVAVRNEIDSSYLYNALYVWSVGQYNKTYNIQNMKNEMYNIQI